MKKSLGSTSIYIITVSLFLLAVNAALGISLTIRSTEVMKSFIGDRMLDISNTAASMIDGDVLEKLEAKDEHTPEYHKILNDLAHFQDNIDLKYIYCIKDMGNKQFTFTVDPTVEDPAQFGDPVVYTDALYHASLGQAAVDEEPYTDQWGRFYSSYSPVFNSKGKVAGIVAVDFSADWYEKQVTTNVIIIAVITALSLSFGAAIVLMIASRSRRRFRLLYNELNNLSDGIETLAKELSDGRALKGTELLHRDEREAASNDDIDYISNKIRSLKEYMSVQIGYVRSKAYRDALTGLENRTAYLEYLTVINEKIVDQTADFSVAMFDINGLKDINDNNGHERGDKEILKAARILKEVFADERIFRIGGDEFVVIIGKTGIEAKDLMEKYNYFIANAKSFEGIHILMSTGFSEYDKNTDKTYQDTFDRADKAMYENKKAYYETIGDRRHR